MGSVTTDALFRTKPLSTHAGWQRFGRLVALATFIAVGSACVSFSSAVEISAAWLRGADGTVLEMEVASCGASHRIEVEESETRVEVLVRGAVDDEGDTCADIVSLTLDAPLGNRVLIDRSDGEEVEVVRD